MLGKGGRHPVMIPVGIKLSGQTVAWEVVSSRVQPWRILLHQPVLASKVLSKDSHEKEEQRNSGGADKRSTRHRLQQYLKCSRAIRLVHHGCKITQNSGNDDNPFFVWAAH